MYSSSKHFIFLFFYESTFWGASFKIIPPIRTPLCNISAHIIKTQLILTFQFYVMCVFFSIPSYIIFIITARINCMKTNISSTCGIFPFYFSWKSKCFSI